METTLDLAARVRATGVQQRSHRPQQRRSAPEAGSLPRLTARTKMEAREAGEDAKGAHFNGLASAYEQPYEMYDFFGPYTEIVTAGAGEVSLARRDLDVPLVLSHDSLRRIARTSNGTLTLTETDDGLDVDAPNLDMDDRDVAYIVPKIRAGLIDEMSFMFRIERGHWSPDYTEYRIEEYDIHRGDVAIVGFGANPFTLSELRAEQPAHKRGRDLIPADEVRLLGV
jgi:HK97 family phage prohead protease